MAPPSDNDLVREYLGGNTQALNELLSRYIAPLYRFILRVTGDAAQAEDIVQESCLKAWRKLSSFQTERSFKTWIFTIARNTAFDYLKKKKAIPFSALDDQSELDEPFQERIEDDRPLASELLEREDSAKLLDVALQELPTKSRTVVLLHEGEDMTFQEISETVQEPLNTVKSRYRRALLTLRTILRRPSA